MRRRKRDEEEGKEHVRKKECVRRCGNEERQWRRRKVGDKKEEGKVGKKKWDREKKGRD